MGDKRTRPGQVVSVTTTGKDSAEAGYTAVVTAQTKHQEHSPEKATLSLDLTERSASGRVEKGVGEGL